MMRAIAEFIMRSRIHASVALLLGFFLPILQQSIVGLVTLRNGVREGLFLVAIALVFSVIATSIGIASSPYFWGTLLSLLAVLLPTTVLRATSSWSVALQVLVAMALVSAISAVELLPELLDEFQQYLSLMLAVMNSQSSPEELLDPSMVSVTGLLGMSVLLNGLVGLLLARWLQSLLYNPGGFGSEFRQLRLGLVPSSLFLLGFLYCVSQGSNYFFWYGVFAIPLILVAVSTVHFMVVRRRMSNIYLLVLYVAMIVFSPILLMLVILGYLDSWLNIRDRYGK
ncbi:MAG: hypothetical protein ACJA04_001086 [Cellvibrionaceae bacterium]|jgi:hypothetical protein